MKWFIGLEIDIKIIWVRVHVVRFPHLMHSFKRGVRARSIVNRSKDRKAMSIRIGWSSIRVVGSCSMGNMSILILVGY